MNTFKMLRKEKKITQSELAKQLDIDQTTVSKWELDKALPDTTMLIKLAKFFDVSTDYLLSLSEYYYPDKLTNNSFSSEPMSETYSSEERQLIRQYRSLPDKIKKTIRDQIEVYSEPSELLPKQDKKV